MRSVVKFFSLALLVAASFSFVPAAQAADPVYKGTFSDKAVGGYDTVAYFKEGKPVKGSAQFKTEYKGATWQFSSQASLDAFKASPDKYAPQYGGYCAFAVGSYNKLVSADPEAWKIVDGKLYLNYDKDIQKDWVANQSEFIKKGDANWPNLIK